MAISNPHLKLEYDHSETHNTSNAYNVAMRRPLSLHYYMGHRAQPSSRPLKIQTGSPPNTNLGPRTVGSGAISEEGTEGLQPTTKAPRQFTERYNPREGTILRVLFKCGLIISTKRKKTPSKRSGRYIFLSDGPSTETQHGNIQHDP
ncbi:hypothetical protein CLAIMM_01019 isoform 4 [Cladophialophora immunda]|nr:hypothetical protein CLAIMM_01019 isoform 2 [Cladophialophora immunda]OQU94693.1 hypothetical protein CLAIMM_01019 isoform 4 [Cladophialophora immunda]